MSQSSGPKRTDFVWKEYLRKSNLKWFTETRRSGIHTLQSQEDVVASKSILGFAQIWRAMGGYKVDNKFVISLLEAFLTTSTWIWQLL